MKRLGFISVFPVSFATGLFFITPVFGGYGFDFPVAELVKNADAILVGSILNDNPSASAVVFRIAVDRVLKGNVAAGQTISVRYVFPASYRGSRYVSKDRGLFFLHSITAGNYKLLPASLGTASFASHYYPVRTDGPPTNYAYATNAPVLDKVLSELAESAETSNGVDGFGNFGLSTVRRGDSALVAMIFRRFSESSSVNLRALGLSWRIADGDVAALRQGLKEVGVLGNPKSRWGGAFVSGFSGFRGTNPVVIRELGRISVAPDSSGELRQAVAYSLRAVHTKETVPFLIRLLDDRDRDVRDNSLHGLNSFVVGLPVERAGVNMDEARDAVLNPGHKKPVSSWPASQLLGLDAGEEASRYVRFGRISDLQEEARYIEFWKGWWQRYSVRLPR